MHCARVLAISCLLAASSAVGGTATADAKPPTDLVAPGPVGRLSDERTLTRWSTALQLASVRTRPDAKARAITRLRFLTEDRMPEVYVALEQTVGADGAGWVRIRLPRRPNGTTGWVPRAALNAWRRSTSLLTVSRRTLTATLRRDGRVVWRSRVGIGAVGTPTPSGRFYVRERLRNLAGNPMYGPIAFGTSAYSRLSDWPGGGVIGIHGTNQPSLIPGRVSHGCIRVPNGAIRRLARLLTVGTPVRIEP